MIIDLSYHGICKVGKTNSKHHPIYCLSERVKEPFINGDLIESSIIQAQIFISPLIVGLLCVSFLITVTSTVHAIHLCLPFLEYKYSWFALFIKFI